MIRRYSEYREGPEPGNGKSTWWIAGAIVLMIVTSLASGALITYLLKHYGITYQAVLWHPRHEIH